MRKRKTHIPNSLSPDSATCEHCKRRIDWDDYSYIHTNGEANCRDHKHNAEPTTWFEDTDSIGFAKH